MIPRTPDQIRAWLECMGISHALAAEALGLGNPDTVMREYCSGRRHPTETTRKHMDLLETVMVARQMLRNGRTAHAALDRLERALGERNLIDLEIDTTPERKSHD